MNPDLEDSADAEEVNDEEWDGIADETTLPIIPDDTIQREDEYVDEDKYTTVTVEAMGEEPTIETVGESVGNKFADGEDNKTKKRPWGKKASDGKAKPKKKFRYESKAERQVTRQRQQKSSRAAKARREKKPVEGNGKK